MRLYYAESAILLVWMRLKFSYNYTLRSGEGPNIKFNYRYTDWGESLPWTAFFVPSYPYLALIELGASYLALRELVGPIKFLHFLIASWATNSIPTA